MTDYGILLEQVRALSEDALCNISTLANVSALLFESLGDVNWAGFYLAGVQDGSDGLLLGPFAGRPACIAIPYGKGVCGTAFARRETVVVKDVHGFEGHIACDPRSRSEIVVPLFDEGGGVIAVLDIDSESPGRFSDWDADGLERICRALEKSIRGTNGGRWV